MKKIILGLAVLSVSMAAALADDRPQYIGDYAWDLKAAKRAGSVVTFWAMRAVDDGQRAYMVNRGGLTTAKANGIKSHKSTQNYDCARKQFRTAQIMFLDADGKLAVPQQDMSSEPWYPANPGSAIEVLGRAVCDAVK